MIVTVTMPYSPICPLRTVFKGASKQDLLAYGEWFHGIMPERIAELTGAVQGTGGFEMWAADLTPGSLGPLGGWFQRQVETREKTQAELDEIHASVTFPMDIPGWELSDKTFSLAMDIGMYFGQVVVSNVSGTKWDQVMQDPRFIDYGKPVVVGRGRDRLEPVQIAVMLAYGFARKNRSGGHLREFSDVWAEKLH
jgi:hypothetical protein